MWLIGWSWRCCKAWPCPRPDAARETAGDLLLYTPVVAASEFDVAISYLFRRLEENASDANFIRHLFSTGFSGSPAFRWPGRQRRLPVPRLRKFRTAVNKRHSVDLWSEPNPESRRGHGFDDRPDGRPTTDECEYLRVFANEPDYRPGVARANRRVGRRSVINSGVCATVRTRRWPPTTEEVDRTVATVRDRGNVKWAERPAC